MKKLTIAFFLFLFFMGCAPAQYNTKSLYLRHNDLGLKYLAKGQYELAIKEFNIAISLNPYDAVLYNNRGWAYYYSGMYDAAMKDFNEALNKNPRIHQAYNGRGLIYYLKGQYDLAIREYNMAISLAPSNEVYYSNLGFAYLHKRSYNLALKNFSKSISLKPDFANPYYGRCLVFYNQYDYDSAIVEVNRAIELNPNNYEYYSTRGSLYWYKGKISLAIEDYSKALKFNPKDSITYANRAIAYAALGRWEKAKKDLLIAKRLNTKEAHHLYHLAFVLYKTGSLKEAKKTLFQAIKVQNNIMEERGSYLKRPVDSKILKFYAEEYLFAAQYLKAPKEYVKIATNVLNIRSKKKIANVRPPVSKEERRISSLCVDHYPNRYLLAILISEYDELPDLPFVRNDKKLILKLADCFWGIPKDNISILENPTLATIKRKLREFLWSIHKKDAQIFLYYSGHGVINSRGEFFLLPKDAYIDSEEDLLETAISLKDVERRLKTVAGLKLAMIDACRINPKWKAAMVINVKRAPQDMSVMFSTSLKSISGTQKKGKYSAFLSALYKMASSGIENLDFDNSGYVEINELIKPLILQVRKITTVKQKPQVIGNKNFPLFPLK